MIQCSTLSLFAVELIIAKEYFVSWDTLSDGEDSMYLNLS